MEQEAFLSLDDFRKRANDPNKIHFMGLAVPRRPGVIGFGVFLEYIHFPPYNPKPDDPGGAKLSSELIKAGLGLNDDYDSMVIQWQEMAWAVTSIPKDKMAWAEETAEIFGLRIANGCPMMVGGGLKDFQRVPFPNYQNVYTLENTKGHVVYTNDQAKIKEILEVEDEGIDLLIKKFYDGTIPPQWQHKPKA